MRSDMDQLAKSFPKIVFNEDSIQPIDGVSPIIPGTGFVPHYQGSSNPKNPYPGVKAMFSFYNELNTVSGKSMQSPNLLQKNDAGRLKQDSGEKNYNFLSSNAVEQ